MILGQLVLISLIGLSQAQIDLPAPAMTNIPCVSSIDCPVSMTCDFGFCRCPYTMQAYLSGQCKVVAGGECDQASYTCMDDASCDNGKCSCNDGTLEEAQSGYCGKLPGQSCEMPHECYGFGSVDCISGICTCLPEGNGMPDSPCYKDFGSSCTTDDDCMGSPWKMLVCQAGTCDCAFGQQYNENYDMILPAGRCEVALGTRCYVNGHYFGMCGVLSSCLPVTGLCECRDFAERVDGQCQCNEAAFLTGPDTMCQCFEGSQVVGTSPLQCKCPSGTQPNKETRRCE